MSDERIRLKRKAAGYTRTVTAVHLKLKHLKLKRMTFKYDGCFYSAYSLATALGIDPHAVTRWIKSGHLKAKLRGTARTAQQNGDSYLIQEKDLRRFILEHRRHRSDSARMVRLGPKQTRTTSNLLSQRRSRVRDLLLSLKNSSRNPFPNGREIT